MAEGLEKLESELTCPLCLLVFQEPKKLNCDHVYCKLCLEGLAKSKKNCTIECPECRIISPIPNNEVANFPTAFHINRLKDVHDTFAKQLRRKSFGAVSEAAPDTCGKHRSQSLAMYCETCQEQICRDCVLASDSHQGHKYGYNDQIGERIRGELEEKTAPLKQMEVSASAALEKVKQIQAEIKSQGELLQESIEVVYTEILSRLLHEKSALEKQVTEEIQQRASNISRQADTIQQARKELRAAMESIETATQNMPEVTLITTQTEIKEGVEKVREDFKSIALAPCEAADVGVEIASADLHGQTWKDNSYTYRLADPKKCTVTGSALSYVETNTKSIIQVNIVDVNGEACTGRQRVKIDIRRLRDGTPGFMQVLDQGAGLHEVVFQAASRGRYSLSIEVNGNHIAQSPYSIFVTKPPHEISAPLKRITDLKSPSGLTYSRNKLIISNYDHSHVTVIDCRGERENIVLPSYSPTGSTIDKEGNYYVCTVRDSKLHKINKSGQRLKSTITGQFNFPNGLHLSEDEELYVCDSNNDRIRVFDTDLNLLRTIATKSVKSGGQCTPVDLDMNDGRLYVVEHGNHRIEVIDSDGTHMLTIGSKRGNLLHGSSFSLLSNHERLSKPAGVKVFKEFVYVADWEFNCIFVHTKQGQLVNSFGADVLKHPEGLTVDDDGYVYVANDRKEVIVF